MPALTGQLGPWGPTIDLKVMQSHQWADALRKAGQQPSPPSVVVGLIDTGASCSALDTRIVKALNLSYRGYTPIHTPSTGSGHLYLNQFDACFVLGEPHPNPLVLVLPVVECDFASQGFFALIGRDVLRRCVLTYDGPADSFTLAF
jgi:hypothetical protein